MYGLVGKHFEILSLPKLNHFSQVDQNVKKTCFLDLKRVVKKATSLTCVSYKSLFVIKSKISC